MSGVESRADEFGPWNPGIASQIPSTLRHLSTILRSENVFTSVASATELQLLTGFTLAELVAFRPERLVLHELMIRVMADLSVPTGETIGDLGINFRKMTNVLLQRYIEPEMGAIVREYDMVRRRLAEEIGSATVRARSAAPAGPTAKPSLLAQFIGRLSHRERGLHGSDPPSRGGPLNSLEWAPEDISAHELTAANASDPLIRAAHRALARVLSALFTTHGRAWGTAELIHSVATDMACNTYGSDAIGDLLQPIVRRGASAEGFEVLPQQERPVIINTKGASASGKSSLRPLQRKLAGDLALRWPDFALISPDIWRKQLLDYGSLGPAYKYAGAFTSEELQIVDQKLDRYMARKHDRGDIPHLLIDRFRFDSFAPDSDEAGSNLLTRFGDSVYLFFVITPPEQLVERAWMRGLEFGRYKAVDDTLAHSVEAYVGMPNVFFTWVRRTDKRIHLELLDNSVQLGQLPRTVAFGDNYTLNVLDIDRLLDIERFGRVNVNASDPGALYPDRALLAPEHNVGFLKRSMEVFREVNFAAQDTGRIYLQVQSGVPIRVDREALQTASEDHATLAALRVVAPGAFAGPARAIDRPLFLNDSVAQPTLGKWGQPRKSP